MKCKKCGSIYGREDRNACPICGTKEELEFFPIVNGYHCGRMPIHKVGKIVDSHDHTIHLGVELEVDSFPSEKARHDCALEVFKILNKKSRQFVKLERDGSLNNGFEIITQPIQFGYHKNSMHWKEAFQAVENFGGSSHDSGNCGLHVHLEAVSPRFVRNIWYLVNHIYKDELQIFSCRSLRRMSYCAFDTGDYRFRNTGHCVAVNTDTSTGCTVEIRIFRGTTKYETFMETLRLVERLAWLALDNSDVMVAYNNHQLPKFLSLLTPYGKQFMTERGYHEVSQNTDK